MFKKKKKKQQQLEPSVEITIRKCKIKLLYENNVFPVLFIDSARGSEQSDMLITDYPSLEVKIFLRDITGNHPKMVNQSLFDENTSLIVGNKLKLWKSNLGELVKLEASEFASIGKKTVKIQQIAENLRFNLDENDRNFYYTYKDQPIEGKLFLGFTLTPISIELVKKYEDKLKTELGYYQELLNIKDREIKDLKKTHEEELKIIKNNYEERLERKNDSIKEKNKIIDDLKNEEITEAVKSKFEAIKKKQGAIDNIPRPIN